MCETSTIMQSWTSCLCTAASCYNRASRVIVPALEVGLHQGDMVLNDHVSCQMYLSKCLEICMDLSKAGMIVDGKCVRTPPMLRIRQ